MNSVKSNNIKFKISQVYRVERNWDLNNCVCGKYSITLLWHLQYPQGGFLYGIMPEKKVDIYYFGKCNNFNRKNRIFVAEYDEKMLTGKVTFKIKIARSKRVRSALSIYEFGLSVP